MKKLPLFLTVCLLTLALSAPAMAFHMEPIPGAALDFYASIGLSTESRSTNYSDFQEDAGKEDTTVYGMDHSSVFGAQMKHGNFFGKFEIGFTNFASSYNIKVVDNNISAYTDTVYARLLYGTYKFNDIFALTVGQAYNPFYFWTNSESVNGNAGTGYGNGYDQRAPMIRLDIGPAYLIAEKVFEVNPPSVGATATSTKAKMPKVCAGFDTKIDKHLVGAGVEYQSYLASNSAAADLKDERLTSWVAFAHGQMQVIDKLYLKSQIYTGQNTLQIGETGSAPYGPTFGAKVNSDGDGFDNTRTTAGYLLAQADFGQVRPFAGYGYSVSNNDQYDNKDAQQEYYVGAAVDVWKSEHARLYAVPEIHVFDKMKDSNGEKEDKITVVGARWKLAF